MLNVSRRTGESVLIGDTIRVTVCRVRGGQVQLGISAPKEIRVDREEVRERRNGHMHYFAMHE